MKKVEKKSKNIFFDRLTQMKIGQKSQFGKYLKKILKFLDSLEIDLEKSKSLIYDKC